MEQPEAITQTQGWCLNCTCRPHFHVGDEDGDCRNCRCKGFVLDNYRDSVDKRNLELMAVHHNTIIDASDIIEPEEELEDYEIVEIEEDDGRSSEVFMGEVSRGCSSCGEQKLYKDFNNSNDPNVICNYCLWEQNEYNQLDESLTDSEREELIDAEDEIIENELAYYEAIERQEILDEVLRGLDE